MLTFYGPDGGISIVLPPGAVDQLTRLVYEFQETAPAATGNIKIGDHTFTLTAYQNGNELSDFTFQKPVLLVIDYSDAEVAGFDENLLELFLYDEGTGEWSNEGITVLSRDPDTNRIVVEVTRIAQFALGAAEYTLYQPIIQK